MTRLNHGEATVLPVAQARFRVDQYGLGVELPATLDNISGDFFDQR